MCIVYFSFVLDSRTGEVLGSRNDFKVTLSKLLKFVIAYNNLKCKNTFLYSVEFACWIVRVLTCDVF